MKTQKDGKHTDAAGRVTLGVHIVQLLDDNTGTVEIGRAPIGMGRFEIAKAVQSYPALVAACEAALERLTDDNGIIEGPAEKRRVKAELTTQLRAALAAAKKGKV